MGGLVVDRRNWPVAGVLLAAAIVAATVLLAWSVGWFSLGSGPPGRPDMTVTIGQHTFNVELALDRWSRDRGMMGRAEVPHDFAMLFAYPAPARPDPDSGFWMKDCLVDLDIAFLSPDRRIVTIHTMKAEPGVHPDDLKLYRPTEVHQFAVEFKAGELARRGINVGDRVTFSPAVQDAVRYAR